LFSVACYQGGNTCCHLKMQQWTKQPTTAWTKVMTPAPIAVVSFRDSLDNKQLFRPQSRVKSRSGLKWCFLSKWRSGAWSPRFSTRIGVVERGVNCEDWIIEIWSVIK
jgi:hypothetical protein